MSGKQHVVITGGSSGIGKATAEIYAAKGADISIIARRVEGLEAAKSDIDRARNGAEGRTFIYSADVSDRAAITTAIDQATAAAGVADILITSSGMAVPGYFENIPEDSFERHMQVNYFGTLWAIRAALPGMRARGSGQIVLVSSGAGLIGIFGYTNYSPTKFALRGLAESLVGEVKRNGVAVSIVYPPDTDTPQLHAENETKPEETKAMTATAKMWTAQGVAEIIVKGIEKRKFCIGPGWEMTWLARLHSMIRPVLFWEFDRLARKVRKSRDNQQ